MSPMPSLREELCEAAGGEPGAGTPGICGISALKRSDGGWSGIRSCTLIYTGMSSPFPGELFLIFLAELPNNGFCQPFVDFAVAGTGRDFLVAGFLYQS